MNTSKKLISFLLLAIVLDGCGGGGGSSNGIGDNRLVGNPIGGSPIKLIQTSIGAFGEPGLTATYTYSSNSQFTVAVRYLYPIDVDGDGVDEILVAGFESQPNTPANYKNTKISIFGWSSGQFKDLTNNLLPNSANQVEGVGDVAIGDFNGDGKIDIFLSAYADMNFNVNAYQLINKGGYFEKSIVENVTGWQHGVSSADINKDGYTDVYAAGYGGSSRLYMGGPNGLIPKTLASYSGGSGVALADFLNDGTVTAFIVDHGANKLNDTVLMRFVSDGAGFVNDISRISTPAGSLLGLNGHDIRVKAFDFNSDGLMDVLIFTRENWNGSEWPVNSRIQFLKNMGGGNFIDVTNDLLFGYATNSNASYSPVFIDINNDKRIDVFLSESQYGTSNSTSILINKSDGKFVDSARAELSSQVGTSSGLATALRGPNGRVFFVFESQSYGGSATLRLSEFFPTASIVNQ